jgi:hypothetical protein
MDETKQRLRYLCIVENAAGNTLVYRVWSTDSAPLLSVTSNQPLEANPFPFPTVKMLANMTSLALAPLNYNDNRSLRGWILTTHDLSPLAHAAAYVRVGPLAPNTPGAGPDGFVWILTTHDLSPLAHVLAYVRGRVGPLAPNTPGAGPDGFAWILTLNPTAEIHDASISRILEFVGEPEATFTPFPQVLPEQVSLAGAGADCGCVIS